MLGGAGDGRVGEREEEGHLLTSQCPVNPSGQTCH